MRLQVNINKHLLPAVLLALGMHFGSCQWEDPKGSMVVMSMNVRYDNPGDGINRWADRKDMVAKTILGRSADIIGMQEALAGQVFDLDSLLPYYDYIGQGRQDGKDKGEFCPVFYKMNRFKALDFGTYWLSANPGDTGSIGWDAALPRILTWVRFFDRHINREFYFLNTHFDHIGEQARIESARLLRKFIADSIREAPVVLTGDLNCTPGSAPYQTLVGDHTGLDDAALITTAWDEDTTGTFNGFGQEDSPGRIDYILINRQWLVMSYGVLEVREDDRFISDHWPVIARIKMSHED